MEPNIIRLRLISSHFDPILKSVCKEAYLSLKCTTLNRADGDKGSTLLRKHTDV